MPRYLEPDTTAAPQMLLLADALSPKGEWRGPYVRNRPNSGYVAQPGCGKYLPYYSPSEPHARKLLDKKPA